MIIIIHTGYVNPDLGDFSYLGASTWNLPQPTTFISGYQIYLWLAMGCYPTMLLSLGFVRLAEFDYAERGVDLSLV